MRVMDVAGVVSLRVFHVDGNHSSTWAYEAVVRIPDGRSVKIDCETQWGCGLGLHDSKNGRRWGLSPLRSRKECSAYAREHAKEIIDNATTTANPNNQGILLERVRGCYGLLYRCLCKCNVEYFARDWYYGCDECRGPWGRARLEQLGVRGHDTAATPKSVSPSVELSAVVEPKLSREIALLLAEDDLPARLDAHVLRMRQQYPALKFTRKHAARSLILKALCSEEKQKGTP